MLNAHADSTWAAAYGRTELGAYWTEGPHTVSVLVVDSGT